MSYALTYIFGARDGDGLTLEYQFYDATALEVGVSGTSGIFDLGDGDYLATIAIPDGHVGYVEFRIADFGARQAIFAVNPQEGENLDAKLSEMHGLLGRHSALSDAVYVGNRLMSYHLRLYNSAANALLNDGVTGLLHTYTIQNSFNSSENLLTSVMTRGS